MLRRSPSDSLVVVGEPRSFHLEFSGYYERADQGFGHFITPDDLEIRQPVGVEDLLRDIPGLRMARTPFGTQVLFRKPSATSAGDILEFCQPRDRSGHIASIEPWRADSFGS